MSIQSSPSSIYIHIPFCVRKCLYCDFASYTGKEAVFGRYVDALRAEIRMEAACHPSPRISTIYFGGGTPTALSPTQLQSILDEIRRNFPVDRDAEITTEANPGTAANSPELFHKLLQSGFNRLSLGVQSLHDNELEKLGRIHTAEDAVSAFYYAREAGFGNISLDLMYGIPDQTFSSWRDTLGRIIDLGPEHVSLYSLTVEEGTPFWDMCRAGSLQLPGDDIEADMYEEAIRTLTGAGFVHYEISNFARPGRECRHNITYWQNDPYFGFGVGATGYLEGIRAANSRDIEGYIVNIEAGINVKEYEERLTGRGKMGETMFLGLRMLRGVDECRFTRRYGISPKDAFPSEISRLLMRDLIEEIDGYLRLTRTGLLFANDVFAEFVD